MAGLLVVFDEGLDAVVVCEPVDELLAEVHIAHGVLVDASAPTGILCRVQVCDNGIHLGTGDRFEPGRVQPQILREGVEQVVETVLLEQQHVRIAPVSIGLRAFEP